ncbi:hypothetical protein B0H21DRAFT_69621 [Amylocystis lapponica]|nr:hypothetical protein B0H21DRAFT_69621 [Amylocystis lapponica]
MSDSASSPEPDAQDDEEADPIYLAHLTEHLNQVHSHLIGSDGNGPPPASFFAPSAYWMTTEKEAFFHALAVHSRLRPDLIAAEVKTKNIVDVCNYLDLLEDGSARFPYVVARKDIPPALEVSDRWLALEEQKASAVIRTESGLETQALKDSRDALVQARKNAIRARRGQARTASNERDREGEKVRRSEYEKWLAEKKEEWRAGELLRSLDVAALKAIDRVLREDETARGPDALSIVVQEDSADAPAEPGQETVVPPARESQASTPVIDDALIDPVLLAESRATSTFDDVSARSIPEVPESSQVSSLAPAPSYALAKPHFQPTTPPFQSTSLLPEPPRVNLPTADKITADPDAVLSPASRRRVRKRLWMRRKRSQATGGVVDESVGKLRPGRKAKRRRGVRKTSVDPEGSQSDVDQGGSSQATASRENASASSQDVNAGWEREGAADGGDPSAHDEGETRHPHPSGSTRPYKVRAQLGELGYDAQKLHEEGLGLLHLGGLGKVMRLYNRLHDVSPNVGSEISAETIRLLYAHVVNFTTKVVHRVVVSREQERAAKMHTKVWRVAGKQVITTANVEHALSLLGSDNLSKKTHFGGLLHRLDLEEDEDEIAAADKQQHRGRSRKRKSAKGKEVARPQKQRTRRPEKAHTDDDMNSESDDSKSEDSDNSEPSGQEKDDDDTSTGVADAGEDTARMSSLHRNIFAPSVRLPSYASALSSNPGYMDASCYMPKPAPTPHTLSPEVIAEDELVPDELDMDALLAELLEEEELDKCDRILEEIYEKGLFVKFTARATAQQDDSSRGRKRKRTEGESGSDDDAWTRDMRFREPDLNGRVKSQVYILDSD